ncbi:hypothetical protein [Chryseobacterium scophthalmum]|uniref:Uncharacterized protein n=1 Tax=Chryseobacterium scophthalmum TaxID=59733 RepID=A0A1N6EGS3_9FLAO|nr:hypothetical protein [Chryseobacterium scophthalmum]SIN82245.1 hypothetical protein SAMN05421769_0343 [Chryseobacterium scophthalmum]
MLEITKHGIILRKTDLSFESEGVLNPAIIKVDGKIHLFYRAVAKGNFSTLGHCVLEKRSDSPIIVTESEFLFLANLQRTRILLNIKTN